MPVDVVAQISTLEVVDEEIQIFTILERTMHIYNEWML